MHPHLDELMEFFRSQNKFAQSMGHEFEINHDDKIIYRLKIKEMHLSSPGVAHGGALAGFMDSVLGLTTLYEAFKRNLICSTVEFKLNFIRPAKLGDTLMGVGKVEYWGNSLVVTSADVFDESTMEIVLKGQGTFNLYPLAKKEGLRELFKK